MNGQTRYGVIVHGEATDSKSINIGDYIQALASAQFLPKVDAIIDRETIGSYDGEDLKIIMNAWYMYDARQWPPSPKIHPLFVSMHINSTARAIFSTPQSIAYLKQYEPIGCRDKATEQFLRSLGVEAYFSGCMTLTFGQSYKSPQHDGPVYFVDPATPPIGGVFRQTMLVAKSLLAFEKIRRLCKKRYSKHHGLQISRRQWLSTTAFYYEYRKIFDEHLLFEAEYICQQSCHYAKDFQSGEERMREAERLVRLYARACLVVTSRIHCALPCTGLETPVIYTLGSAHDEASACRMDGLLQLFHVFHITKDGHIKQDLGFSLHNKVSTDNLPPIRTEWRKLADGLVKSCRTFINK